MPVFFALRRYLVLVSDGVSQFMDSDEIIGLVHYLVTKHKCNPSKVGNKEGGGR